MEAGTEAWTTACLPEDLRILLECGQVSSPHNSTRVYTDHNVVCLVPSKLPAFVLCFLSFFEGGGAYRCNNLEETSLDRRAFFLPLDFPSMASFFCGEDLKPSDTAFEIGPGTGRASPDGVLALQMRAVVL